MKMRWIAVLIGYFVKPGTRPADLGPRETQIKIVQLLYGLWFGTLTSTEQKTLFKLLYAQTEDPLWNSASALILATLRASQERESYSAGTLID